MCLEYQTAWLSATAASNEDHRPAWPHGQSQASFKATTGLLSCPGLWDSHGDSGAAFDRGPPACLKDALTSPFGPGQTKA